MTGLVLAITIALALMMATALVNLLGASRLHRFDPACAGPRVSVLVPARDEAGNLRRLLPALTASGYPHLEVVVLDDQSGDETRAVAAGRARDDPRFRLVDGLEPPPGWTGKNWACHQLARQARGDVFLFCDADVVPGPDAVGRTVAALESQDADVVTGLPWHEPGGWFEEAVVPMVTKVPIAALLPLPLVSRTRAVSISVGNGQWMAWRRDAYERVGGHARVKGDVLEDVHLARAAKRHGLRVLPVVATRDLGIRMYRDRSETWDGFGKNLYLLAGGTDASLAVAVALFMAVGAGPFVLPLVAGPGPSAWLALALLAGVRLAAAGLFEDRARSTLLHPVAVVVVVALAVTSRSRHHHGSVSWKRRPVATSRGTIQ
jgi:chlorobactene glucosyltransferase